LRKTLSIGIGAGVAALAATTAAGVASAATSGNAQTTTRSVAAMAAVNRHITRAQAGRIARARVPHSRVHEIESDDLHDRAVWKVQLSTPRGRVGVDVDKKTGRATIVRRGGGGGGHGGGGHGDGGGGGHGGGGHGDGGGGHGGGGHGDAIMAIPHARPGHDARDNDAADDRGQDARDNDGPADPGGPDDGPGQ
jgi:Peptidase propeptide and YPEB domain